MAGSQRSRIGSHGSRREAGFHPGNNDASRLASALSGVDVAAWPIPLTIPTPHCRSLRNRNDRATHSNARRIKRTIR
jgi:hypothetical protein